MLASPLLDPIQLWTLASAGGLMLVGWSLARFQKAADGSAPRRRSWLQSGPARVWAIFLVGCIAFSADALVSHCTRPVPEVLDEFSYLLQADTFAHGRLTNPAPPLAQDFATPYVLVRPTYQSMYPPAQALFLALGERLFSNPLAGVWVSSALFAAALCWMLQAWLPPAWALWGSLLAVCQLACFGHWAQSYFGGMVAGAGGALLFGALRRLVDSHKHRVLSALAFATGLVVLANSRPYEGLVTAIPAVIVLCVFLWRSTRGSRRTGARVAGGDGSTAGPALRPASTLAIMLPVFVVLAVAAVMMAYYNQRVTHNLWTLPYQVYQLQYNPAPIFFFQHFRPMPHALNAALKSSAVDALEEVHWARHNFLDFATSKLFFFWQFAFGALLGLPVLLELLVESRTWLRRILPLTLYFIIEVIAVRRFLFWPAPSEWLVAALLIAVLAQYALLLRIFSGRWERLALLVMGLLVLATLAVSAPFRTHYIAPVIPLTVFLVTEAMRRLVGGQQRMFRALPVAAAIPVLALVTAAAGLLAKPTPTKLWARKRAEIETRLESQPGKQLVFVKYGDGYDYYEDWVHNRADLNHAKVVWARDLETSADNELIRYFPDRKVWWLNAATIELQANPPKEPNELPLLQ